MAMTLVVHTLGKSAVGKLGDFRRIQRHASGGGIDMSRAALQFAWVGGHQGGEGGIAIVLRQEEIRGRHGHRFNLVIAIRRANPDDDGAVGA